MWKTKFDAWWAGFMDGYFWRLDTRVEIFHKHYERGFIHGWAAKHRNPK